MRRDPKIHQINRRESAFSSPIEYILLKTRYSSSRASNARASCSIRGLWVVVFLRIYWRNASRINSLRERCSDSATSSILLRKSSFMDISTRAIMHFLLLVGNFINSCYTRLCLFCYKTPVFSRIFYKVDLVKWVIDALRRNKSYRRYCINLFISCWALSIAASGVSLPSRALWT